MPNQTNVDCQPHNQAENSDSPRPKHRQRRPQHHEQQEQRPKGELERRAGRRGSGLGFWVAHVGLLVAAYQPPTPHTTKRRSRSDLRPWRVGGYLSILQFGNACWSFLTPSSVTPSPRRNCRCGFKAIMYFQFRVGDLGVSQINFSSVSVAYLFRKKWWLIVHQAAHLIYRLKGLRPLPARVIAVCDPCDDASDSHRE